MILYEILVPTCRNDGRPISARCHRVWDNKVINIAGGITILNPAKGTWVSPKGETFKERMIPVRILCTREQIEKIIDMTIEYYEQEAVLAYVISSDTIMKYSDKDFTAENTKYPTSKDLKNKGN